VVGSGIGVGGGGGGGGDNNSAATSQAYGGDGALFGGGGGGGLQTGFGADGGIVITYTQGQASRTLHIISSTLKFIEGRLKINPR
jgi:hypothetical protein